MVKTNMEHSKYTITEAIEIWSEQFNLPIRKTPGFPVNEKEGALALALIEEELQEFKEGLIRTDLTEMQDALGDLLWVTIRAMMTYGFDPDITIERIFESNMSKIDYTQEDSHLTFLKYKELDVPTYSRKNEDKYLTFRASDHKVLKSHNFKEPDFKIKK